MDIIFPVVFIAFLGAPLLIQQILYQIMKLCFKKTPHPLMYTICLAVNTILLYMIKAWLSAPYNPDEMEPMDALDGALIMILWAPCYVVVLILCIIKIMKATKPKQNTDNF